MPKISQDRFTPSGLNQHLNYAHWDYLTYCAHMRDVIASTRLDLTDATAETIINANCPVEKRPAQPKKQSKKIKTGILLIHGFLDSPHIYHNVLQHWKNSPYLIRTLLLPGHGTRPGDLLTVHAREYLRAVKFAIDSFNQEVEQVIVVGYSLGGTLSLLQYFQGANIGGLILFAPAVELAHMAMPLIDWHEYISPIWPHGTWYNKQRDDDYAKYRSIPFHAIHQVNILCRQLNDSWPGQPFNIPLLMTLSIDDEIVNIPAARRVFRHNTNPDSRLLIYSATPEPTPLERRAILRSSYFPEHRVLNFSHVALLPSLEHPHNGPHGDFIDKAARYSSLKQYWRVSGEPYYGAISLSNLLKYRLLRSTFNPDFNYMMSEVDQFIERLENKII